MMLPLFYISLTAVMTVVILLFGIKSIKLSVTEVHKRRKYIFTLITSLCLWHFYTFLIAHNKVLYDFEFPPKFALLLIIPLFLFTAVFFYKSKKKKWIHAIPLKWLIFIQSFRILVETIFVLTVSAGILHADVTLEGYNYDFSFGISAILIGLLFIKNKHFKYYKDEAREYNTKFLKKWWIRYPERYNPKGKAPKGSISYK